MGWVTRHKGQTYIAQRFRFVFPTQYRSTCGGGGGDVAPIVVGHVVTRAIVSRSLKLQERRNTTRKINNTDSYTDSRYHLTPTIPTQLIKINDHGGSLTRDHIHLILAKSYTAFVVYDKAKMCNM